jgi:hypothetical protein
MRHLVYPIANVILNGPGVDPEYHFLDHYSVIPIPEGTNIDEMLVNFGLSAEQVSIIEEGTFTKAQLYFLDCFNFVDTNTVTFDFDRAKLKIKGMIQKNPRHEDGGEDLISLCAPRTLNLMISQAALPEAERDPEVQAFFDQVNFTNALVKNKLAAVEAAIDASELLNIGGFTEGVDY